MLRLRPTVITITMAEVKEVERRRLFHKHLEQTMDQDKSHRWQKIADVLLQDMMPVSATSTSTVAGQESTMGACSEKGTAAATSNIPEDMPMAVSPVPSTPSMNEEISDEELLPHPGRSRRWTRRQMIIEVGERHSSQEEGSSRAQRRLRASRPDLPTARPANPTPEQLDSLSLATPARTPRDPPNIYHNGFAESSQTIRQEVSDLSFITNDEMLPWPSSPVDLAESSSRTPAHGRASVREVGGPLLCLMSSCREMLTMPKAHLSSDDGREAARNRLTPRRREGRVDTRQPDPITRPSSAGSSSTPTVPRTPNRLQIYNDSLPASSQPQTPQNLPEARHQSRLRVSWTAPSRRRSPHPFRTPTTSRVRRLGRGGQVSPPGLQNPPGFTGLYGGIENTDDTVLFEAWRELASGDSQDAPPS